MGVAFKFYFHFGWDKEAESDFTYKLTTSRNFTLLLFVQRFKCVTVSRQKNIKFLGDFGKLLFLKQIEFGDL